MTSIEEQIKEMTDQRREAAERLRFFDAGIWLGEPAGFPLARELPTERLGDALRERFLCGGMVSHWCGKVLSAQDGNAVLMQVLDGCQADVYAVWTGLPLLPGEGGLLPGVGPVPGKVKAARIFPKAHNFRLVSWCIGKLCEWLASRRMPLFIWHVETDWKSLHELARTFPKLQIVVETQTQKILYHTRPVFALMRDCRNVRVELSNFAGQGFIEYAVREFGAERLIFGSFLPVNDPLVPMGMVLDAKISEAEKALIAGGNLRRMVSEVTP